MSDTKGDTARQMAAAPLSGQMSDALKTAAIESSVKGAEKLSKAIKKNPIAEFFGLPTFQLLERVEYQDKRVAGKTNSKLAVVLFNLVDGFTLSASIYQDQTLEKTAEGTFATQTTRFSLPKGFAVDKGNPVTVRHLESFKADMLSSYLEWIKTVDASTPIAGIRRSAAGGHVERIKVS